MEESQHHKQIFGFFQIFIYFYIFIDIYVQCFSIGLNQNAFFNRLNSVLWQWPAFTNVIVSHVVVFFMIVLLGGLALSRKSINFDIHKHFTYRFIIGGCLFVLSIFLLPLFGGHLQLFLYASTYIMGALFLHIAIANLSKRIFNNLKKDIWNTGEESFQQNQKLIKTPYSFNLPIQYYFRKKLHKGWMNINPFRGMMVIGVPGTGKTASVIEPYIKQLLHKGFAMLVYDFKYPDLSEITYHHYKINHLNNGPLKDHKFHIINTDDIEHSRRVNPIAAQYINTLADASETAEAIISALKKSEKSQGSQQFFTQSAINFLAAIIYFLATYDQGQYSTLPHMMACVNMPYDRLFNKLFAHPELRSLLAPFKSAYENEAFDQLEGQIGTVRINISRLATKESFWVFSGNDFNLKFSNPPSVVVLANSPATQNINSAFYSAVIMRMVRLINTKNNYPSALVIDEAPTIFLHKIENLIATARSNKVAIALGLQELPQFHLQYGKELANSISSIMGTIISGAVRNKETLEWLERLFGKIKQTHSGVNVNHHRTNISMNARMETLIPAAKIANLNAGEMVALVSRENEKAYGLFKPNMYNCKIDLDFKKISAEQKHYTKMPKYYTFGNEAEKKDFLMRNMDKIYRQIEEII